MKIKIIEKCSACGGYGWYQSEKRLMDGEPHIKCTSCKGTGTIIYTKDVIDLIIVKE